MAKKVECKQEDVDNVLEEHERDWTLVAVIRPPPNTGRSDETGNWEEEWRELYFERREKKSLQEMLEKR